MSGPATGRMEWADISCNLWAAVVFCCYVLAVGPFVSSQSSRCPRIDTFAIHICKANSAHKLALFTTLEHFIVPAQFLVRAKRNPIRSDEM